MKTYRDLVIKLAALREDPTPFGCGDYAEMLTSSGADTQRALDLLERARVAYAAKHIGAGVSYRLRDDLTSEEEAIARAERAGVDLASPLPVLVPLS